MKTKYHDKFVDWDDKKLLQEVITRSSSRVEVLRNLDYYPYSAISRKKLNDAIVKFNLDISNFNNRSDRWKTLPSKIQDCFSISDVLRAVGLFDQGANHKTAKKAIKELGLDTSHFIKNTGGAISPYSNDDIFCENSIIHRSTVKKRIIKEQLLKYKCSECGITEWNTKKLSLQLDHINGINNDHRLENLRFLCPNCHSLTPTYGNKNRTNGKYDESKVKQQE